MSLHAVFSPRSVAIIGASSQKGSVGNDIVKNLQTDFAGKIYPVNLKGGELYGLPVYTQISEIKGSVDLAIICVPAVIVADVLRDACKTKKIKAAIVISAGFKEIGNTLQEQNLKQIADKYHCTLVGPNCLGVMNPHLRLNASFAPTMPKAGSIAFLSQSGALGVAVLDYAKAHDLGFSKFMSMGNKAALDEAELLEFLNNDPLTEVILLYVENLSDFKKILKVAHKMRSFHHPKPIIVLKSGSTAQGAHAAQSHTGALAGSDALYDALFHQAGMLRVSSVEELFMYAECFLYNPLLKKDRVAVVTNAGGIGVLVTDALVKEKLTLSPISTETQEKLRGFLPAAASVHNPIDILGDADSQRYRKTLEIVSEEPAVDAIVVLLTPQSMTDVENIARAVLDTKKNIKKPIIVSFLGGDRVQQGLGILHRGEVATAAFPESTAQALSILHRFALWKNALDTPRRFRDVDSKTVHHLMAQQKQSGWLDEATVLTLLTAYKLPVVRWQVVRHERELASAVAYCGGKTGTVVLKILSPDIIHKSDVGGVVLGVTQQDSKNAYTKLLTTIKEKMPQAHIDGVLVMEQLTLHGTELIIGGVRDGALGAIIGCGMGGIFTESFNDAAFSLAPVDADDIADIFNRLKITPILRGARGQKPSDMKALEECIARLSQLLTDLPQIAEIDINPVVLLQRGSGAQILDARIKVI
ncbi:acetate--CoA ligase family protein [Candidatus Woesebacteria bacterium]|nr:acetate--CoA ligase family protein [Candidatus Woesebacteria bacterium]